MVKGIVVERTSSESPPLDTTKTTYNNFPSFSCFCTRPLCVSWQWIFKQKKMANTVQGSGFSLSHSTLFVTLTLLFSFFLCVLLTSVSFGLISFFFFLVVVFPFTHTYDWFDSVCQRWGFWFVSGSQRVPKDQKNAKS